MSETHFSSVKRKILRDVRQNPLTFPPSFPFTISVLTLSDLPSVYSLCLGNPLYYKHLNCPLTPDLVQSDFTALPPGKNCEDKYFLGFCKNGSLAAVMDLVFGYPDEKTVYIGFFMVDRQLQGKGTGSLIISHTADILQRQSYRFMKLAWVEGNRQSEHFWRKNGFEPNGRSSHLEACTVAEAVRPLQTE